MVENRKSPSRNTKRSDQFEPRLPDALTKLVVIISSSTNLLGNSLQYKHTKW